MFTSLAASYPEQDIATAATASLSRLLDCATVLYAVAAAQAAPDRDPPFPTTFIGVLIYQMCILTVKFTISITVVELCTCYIQYIVTNHGHC